LSSQQSTSPLESETLLDQVAHVVAQDCEENSEEHESRQGDPSQNITEIPNDLLFKILRAGDRLVALAPQLITNRTSNLAECFMSMRAKFDGGKFYKILSCMSEVGELLLEVHKERKGVGLVNHAHLSTVI